jgi:DNA-binding XRE family transcriptional regulator
MILLNDGSPVRDVLPLPSVSVMHDACIRTPAMNSADLRRRRLRIGWSREQLAHAVGVSPTTLRAWEDGTAPVSCPHAVEQLLRQREEDTRDWLPRAS